MAKGRRRLKATSFIDTTFIKWVGLEAVTSNLNKEIKKIEGRTVGGLIAAALEIKRDAVTLTPVDTGNLRNSTYVVAGGGGKKTTSRQSGKEGNFEDKKAGSNVAGRMQSDHTSIMAQAKAKVASDPFAEIGFTAYYAMDVHENVGNYHKIGQAKFLERAFLENKRRIFSLIKERAKV